MDTKELGKIIRDYRKSHNYTQTTVSQMSNVGSRFLSDLERGKETAEIGLVLKILKNMSLDVLIVPRSFRSTPEYRHLKEAMDARKNS